MKTKRMAPAAAMLAAGALVLSACGNTSATGEDATTGGELSGTLTGVGASSQSAAIDAWVAGFGTTESGVTVQYSPDGSGAGREQFLNGSAQFAGSDAPLDEDEVETAKEVCGEGGAYEFPVYISPIALAFNVEGVDELNLTPENIARIFKGEITNWNDPALAEDNEGVELPDLNITAVHRSDDSGTTENFTEYLDATVADVWGEEPSDAFPSGFGGEAAQGTSGVVQTISGANGAIGYADASAVGELSTAKVQVGDDFTELSAEAAAAVVDASEIQEGRGEGDLAFELARDTTESGAYPIVLVSYHIICSAYPDQETADLVKAWESYVVSEEGQNAAAESAGSAPISDSLRAQIEETLELVTVQG